MEKYAINSTYIISKLDLQSRKETLVCCTIDLYLLTDMQNRIGSIAWDFDDKTIQIYTYISDNFKTQLFESKLKPLDIILKAQKLSLLIFNSEYTPIFINSETSDSTFLSKFTENSLSNSTKINIKNINSIGSFIESLIQSDLEISDKTNPWYIRAV